MIRIDNSSNAWVCWLDPRTRVSENNARCDLVDDIRKFDSPQNWCQHQLIFMKLPLQLSRRLEVQHPHLQWATTENRWLRLKMKLPVSKTHGFFLICSPKKWRIITISRNAIICITSYFLGAPFHGISTGATAVERKAAERSSSIQSWKGAEIGDALGVGG